MNTVIFDNPDRTVISESPQRVVKIAPILREARCETVSRTVDIVMTYTLEEFYYISPFQINKGLGEGPIYVIPNKTV
jgi:hypothetical protein